MNFKALQTVCTPDRASYSGVLSKLSSRLSSVAGGGVLNLFWLLVWPVVALVKAGFGNTKALFWYFFQSMAAIKIMGLSTLLWLRPSRLGANGNDFEIGEQPGDFTDLSELLRYIMVNFTVVLVAVTTLFFFWGLYKFIRSLHQGDSEGVTSGKQFMVWGVIALFLSLFFLGVVALLNFTIWGGPGLDFPLLPGSES